MMRIAALAIVAAVLLAVPAPVSSHRSPQGPASAPPPLLSSERTTLDAGGVVVRWLPAKTLEIGLLCAIRVSAGIERFQHWARIQAEYRQGPYVAATGRFSDPPKLSDLAGLELTDADLKSLRQCVAGDCGLKLSAAEMSRLRAAARVAGDWRKAVQEEFRDVVLRRAQSYLAHGHAEALPYDDRKPSVSLNTEFAAALAPPGFMTFETPGFAEYLLTYPRTPMLNAESYLFWSVETLGWKPIVSVTHVAILRPPDGALMEAIVASKNVFATHYVSGAVAITALGRVRPDGRRDLVYMNRSRVDVLDGPFGGLYRRVIQDRVRHEAPTVLRNLKVFLESGDELAQSTTMGRAHVVSRQDPGR